MMIICFITQKGGSGKTTLAVNCGVVASERGKRALILDMDVQGTAEAWYQERDADTPQVIKLSPNDLDRAIKAAREKGFDVVLIDTPGRDEPGTAAAIRSSDFCVIPCRPSPADMRATPTTVETVRRLNKPVAFVLTQTPPRSFRNREAENGLSVLGMVCPVNIVLRNAYQDAQGGGLGVTEYEPDGKAAQEVRALWDWLIKKMRKVKNGD